MKNLPLFVVLVLLLIGLTLFRRNRQRAAASVSAAAEKLTVGSEVMTTSGLYATVVAVDTEAGTALLSIAPGVEVTWAAAALRVASDLPDQYRRGAGQAHDRPGEGPPHDVDGPPHDVDGPQSGVDPTDTN